MLHVWPPRRPSLHGGSARGTYPARRMGSGSRPCRMARQGPRNAHTVHDSGSRARVGPQPLVEHVEHLAAELCAGQRHLGPRHRHEVRRNSSPPPSRRTSLNKIPAHTGVERELLPRPARGERRLVQGQQLGVGERAGVHAVAQQPRLVVGVVEDEGVDLGGETHGMAVGGGQLAVGEQRIGDIDLDLSRHPDRGELVEPARPYGVPVEEGVGRRPPRRPARRRPPGREPGGRAAARCRVSSTTCRGSSRRRAPRRRPWVSARRLGAVRRRVVAPGPGAEIPGPAAPLEPRPVRCVNPEGLHLDFGWYGESDWRWEQCKTQPLRSPADGRRIGVREVSSRDIGGGRWWRQR